MCYKKQQAGILLVLILSLLITLPVQVSGLNAQIFGEQNIDGFRQRNDVTTVVLNASTPVFVLQEDASYDMNCEENEDYYACTHTFARQDLVGGKYLLTFEQAQISQTTTWPFVVDDQAPQITLFSVEPATQGSLDIELDISDSAYAGDTTTCSGLKSIDIGSETTQLYHKAFADTSQCEFSKNLSIDGSGISGTTSFYLSVSDYLGQTTTFSTQPQQLDYAAPQLVGTPKFILTNGQEVTHISSQPDIVHQATLEFTLEEESLSFARGDLSSLNLDPQISSGYRDVTFDCQRQGALYHCTSPTIQLNPQHADISLPLRAVDKQGNELVTTLQPDVSLITKQPTITRFSAKKNHCDGSGTCFASNGFLPIELDIQEAHAGISPELITLVTEDFGVQPTIHPIRCNKTDNQLGFYTCFASVPISLDKQNKATKKIILTHPSTDIMGTRLGGKTQTSVVIDNIAPRNTTPLTFSSKGCVVAGEDARFKVQVSDTTSSQLTIFTDVSKVSSKTHFQQRCSSQGDGLFSCELPITDIVSYPESEEVTVYIKDIAGNTVALPSYEVKVCEANTEIEPNFISSISSSTSQEIDRTIASVMPVQLYLPLDITSQSVDILDIQTDGCVDSSYVSQKPYFISSSNAQGNQPVLVVSVGGDSQILPETIPINCTLFISLKRGNVKYLQAEKEELTLEASTRNAPLGSPQEASQEKLTGLREEISTLEQKISRWEKFTNWAKWVCGFIDTITAVGQTASYLRSALLPIAMGLDKAWPGTGESLWASTCPVLHKIIKTSMAFFTPGTSGLEERVLGNLANAGAVEFLGSMLKLGCLTYQCGLCSPEGVLQAVSITYRSAKNLGDNQDDYSDVIEGGVATQDQEEIKAQRIAAQDVLENEINPNIESLQQEYDELLAEYNNKFSESFTTHNEDDETVDYFTSSDRQQYLRNMEQTKSKLLDYQQAQEAYSLKANQLTAGDMEDKFALLWMQQENAKMTQTMDPYKSIHNSQNCFCVPGIIYNQKKHQQLLCKQYHCIQESLKAGLPYTHCETAYKEGACLYYHGAFYERALQGKTVLAQRLLEYTKAALSSAPAIAHRTLCSQDYPGGLKFKGSPLEKGCYPLNDFMSNPKAVACSLTGSILQLRNFGALTAIYDSFQALFGKRNQELEQTNYCQGIDLTMEEDT